MTLRHMKIFVMVCECKSVTVAATRLHLAQPSVSLAISELEEYYGVKLFDRLSRKLFITEIGRQFYNYSMHIVSLFDDLEKGIKNWDTVGTLRVGSSITIGNYLLPECVKLFQQRRPQMKVQVVIDNSKAIEERVLNNDIDFALIEGAIHNTKIESVEFMKDELILICGNNYPIGNTKQIEIEMLKGHDFILREKGSGSREIFDTIMLMHNIEIIPIWESVSTQAIIKAVSAGLGLSVLPYMLVEQALSEGNVRQIKMKDISFKRELYMIYHKNKFLTNSARDFMSLCKAQASEKISGSK